MAAKKVLDANESSLVDLKAELFRKEEQSKRGINTHGNSLTKQYLKKPPAWLKSKKKLTIKSQAVEIREEQSEEDKTLNKSRQKLEAKALLYEKMAKGEIEDEEDEEGSGRFLVDFHRKVYDEYVATDNQANSDDAIEMVKPDEEWVDYMDSLGRSRRCMKKDLPQLQEMDKDFTPKKSPSPPTLLSEDMKRELQRQKWEKEEEEAMRRPVGPVHYQNVQFDEVRTHGVGYYQFSKDELERQKQMEVLNTLREQTSEQRARKERLKEKRKATLEARLAKVRAKKAKRLGEEGVTLEEEVQQNEDKVQQEGEADNSILNQSLLQKARERLTDEEKTPHLLPPESDQKIPANKLPEWARQKIDIWNKPKASGFNPHNERDPEFAPPSFYYNQDTCKPKTGGRRGEKQQHATVNQRPLPVGNKTFFPGGNQPQMVSLHTNQGVQPRQSGTLPTCISAPAPPIHSVSQQGTTNCRNQKSEHYSQHFASEDLTLDQRTHSVQVPVPPSDQALDDFLLQCRHRST